MATTNPTATPATSLRAWRRSRPFLAGLLTLSAALELALVPLYTARFLLVEGSQGIGGILVPAALTGCATLLWREPRRHTLIGVAILALGFTSYVVTNLGGFLVGMLLALIGGSLAISWHPTPPAPATSLEDSR